MESVIDGSVRCKYSKREDEVIVRADDVEFVHGCIVWSDVRFYDFGCFFGEVVERIGVKVIVCPACNDVADVFGGIFVEIITIAIFFEPAEGVNVRRIVRECLLTATCAM